MPPTPKTIDEVRSELLEQIQAAIADRGMFEKSTCPINAFGWSKEEHFAMEQIQRHPPAGLHVSHEYRNEVHNWVIVKD